MAYVLEFSYSSHVVIVAHKRQFVFLEWIWIPFEGICKVDGSNDVEFVLLLLHLAILNDLEHW